MLRELRKRKQQVADKIGHEEYIYKLNGDPFSGQEEIRVRPQGDLDRRRGNNNNNGGGGPPFAVDDDAQPNRNIGGRAVGPLNPVAGAAANNQNNNNNNNAGAAALVPVGGGPYNNNNNNNRNYASPYAPPAAYAGPSGNNGGGQPVVSAFAPVMPPMAPVSDLPGPLPPVYRPKPPITFHNNNGGGGGGGGVVPLPPLYSPGYQDGGNGWPAAPAQGYYPPSSNYNNDGARPQTSPSVLPLLSPSRGENNNNNNNNAARSPRPSTSGAAAGVGGGGGFIVGSPGLSDAEDRYREKLAARQRAIELQQENARQMLEQQQRKQAEREREMKDDREAEARLRREREEVARREQAEVDRENRERELKMMGPRAAQEMLEQQRKETEERREAEAAARRNRGKTPQQQQRQQPSAGASGAAGETSAPAADGQPAGNAPPSEKAGSNASSSSSPAQPSPQAPIDQRGPLNFASGLPQAPPAFFQPGAVNPHTAQYFTNIGLGGAGITPPPNTPNPNLYNYNPYLIQHQQQQRQQQIHLEGDVIHEELRHIALLLEAQQLNSAITHNTAPPPWMMMGPQPTSAAGAGTYLTTGLPSPVYSNNHNSPSGHGGGGGSGSSRSSSLGYRSPLPRSSSPPPSSSAGAAPAYTSASAPGGSGGGAYRSFMAGGALPPPPMVYAGSSTAAAASANGNGNGGGPWPGLFSPQPGSQPGNYYFQHGGVNNTPSAGNGNTNFMSSFRGDGADSEELAIEPSCFVMPATAPPPAFIPSFPPSTTNTNVAAAAGKGENGVLSASSSLGEGSVSAHAMPKERPGTGKPTRPSDTPHADRGIVVPAVTAEGAADRRRSNEGAKNEGETKRMMTNTASPDHDEGDEEKKKKAAPTSTLIRISLNSFKAPSRAAAEADLATGSPADPGSARSHSKEHPNSPSDSAEQSVGGRSGKRGKHHRRPHPASTDSVESSSEAPEGRRNRDTSAAGKEKPAEAALVPALSIPSVSDSPVRGATPHMTATEEVEKKARRRTPSPTSRQSPSPTSRRVRGQVIEPPLVVLTPRGHDDEL